MSERTALAFEQREYTLPQLDALANGMATVLEHRGVRSGDRVAPVSYTHLTLPTILRV